MTYSNERDTTMALLERASLELTAQSKGWAVSWAKDCRTIDLEKTGAVAKNLTLREAYDLLYGRAA